MKKTNEANPNKHRKIKKLAIFIVVIATIISLFLLPNFIRVQKLKQQDYYPLYYTYIAMDKEYRMFYMLNTELVNENEVKIIIKNIIFIYII